MDEEVIVCFSDVKWPSRFKGPEAFSKAVRTVFLKDSSGVLFGYNDLKDILMAWLQDEFNECPDSLDFSIALRNELA